MKTWKTLALSIGCLLVTGVVAQDTLSLDQAITLALENEHGIRIAKNDAAIADAQATAGMAGLLPKLDATGRANYSNQDTRLDFSPPLEDVESTGVVSSTLTGQLG